MSFGSAGRRFGVIQGGVLRRDHAWVAPTVLAFFAAFGRGALALLVFAALILAGVVIVKTLDLTLDVLFGLV